MAHLPANTFVYKPLSKSDGDQIRVIELMPGSGAARISCSIKHVRLVDQPRFEAISYCWGDPKPFGSVLCDGEHLNIAESLYLALARLRDSTRTRTLWADAICINQADLDEKNTQVPLMRKIYENAEQVVLWLGEEAENSRLGFALIPKLVAAYEKRNSTGDQRTFQHLQDTGLGAIYNLPNRRNGDDFPGYFKLFKRAWFQRGWVVQEVAVPKNITIYCGPSTSSWDDFMKSLVFLSDMGIASDFDRKGTTRLGEMALTRLAFQQGWDAEVLMLILRHKSSNVTDPRDKVYAMCGMAVDAGTVGFGGGKGLEIRPDYRAPVSEVYRDLTMRILEREHTTAILCVPKNSDISSQLVLPTWVPDLSIPGQTVSLMGVEHNYRHSRLYNAANSSQCYPRFAESNNELCLSGFVVDTICALGEVEPIRLGDDDVFTPKESIAEAFKSRRRAHNWRQLAGLNDGFFWHKKYITGENIEEVYWNILITGYHPGPEVTPEYMQDLSKKWIKHSRKHAWVRRLPFPFFEVALVLGMVLKGGWLLFRLTFWLAFWTPDPPFDQVMPCVLNRRLFKTNLGYLGLACHDARVGDVLAVVKGGRIPLVVRRSGNKWILVGDCYLHGIMKGEAFQEAKCEDMWFV